MNKEESLALYKKGRDGWNKWADEMLARRTKLTETREWMAQADNITGKLEGKNLATQDWLAAATSDFSKQVFENDVDFTNFVFPGDVTFIGATFEGYALFEAVMFIGEASFNDTTFTGDAWFNRRATFTGYAGFFGAKFTGEARFDEATFNGKARFDEATFNGGARFEEATFNRVAQFSRTTFAGEAWFRDTTFTDDAWFNITIFTGQAWFNGTTFAGLARFGGVIFKGNVVFKKAIFKCQAYFEEVTFIVNACFDEATFTGDTLFNKATFTRAAQFYKATFNGNASFSETTFISYARFFKATFFDNTLFINTKFTGDAYFNESTFIGNTRFSQAVFESFTTFRDAIFKKDATFVAMRGQSFFTLKGSKFFSVPDFEQAHFEEAPQLDNSYFPTTTCELRGWQGWFSLSGGDTPARWRALKRLAVQAHDHERELKFLAEEIKSLRGVQDQLLPCPLNRCMGKSVWPGGGRYWAGLVYQLFSDFGRSIWRPLLCWLLFMVAFTLCYLSHHLTALEPSNTLYNWGLGTATTPAFTELTCLNKNPSKPLIAAFSLSFHNSLVFLGLGRSEKLAQNYACLYGRAEDSHAPLMPDAVVFAGLGQTVLSAVLIFLLLLALRNYFRIK